MRIDDILFSGSTRYDSRFDKNKKFIIKIKDEPQLIEPFLIHRSHYYVKDDSTKEISKDPLFPGIVLLKNEIIKDSIVKKIEDERPVKREELKNRLKENFIDRIIDVGLELFSINLIVAEKLMSENEKLRTLVQNAVKGRKNLRKIVYQLKKILPEKDDIFKSKEMERAYQDLFKLSPVFLNDILSLWLYEQLDSLIDFSLSFKNENCFQLDDYDSITNLVEKLEKYDLIRPMLTLSICNKPDCEFQSISNNKIDTIDCPNCKSEGSLFSTILYKFDEFIEDLNFEDKILPDHSYISYLIAHYLHYFSEQRFDVYPLRYVSINNKAEAEEIDILAITQEKEPILFECKIHRDRTGDFDQIKSSCKNGIQQLERKMDFLGAEKGFLITNFRSKSTIDKINRSEKTSEKGIKVISSGEIIKTLDEIIETQMIHNSQTVSN